MGLKRVRLQCPKPSPDVHATPSVHPSDKLATQVGEVECGSARRAKCSPNNSKQCGVSYSANTATVTNEVSLGRGTRREPHNYARWNDLIGRSLAMLVTSDVVGARVGTNVGRGVGARVGMNVG